MWLVDRNCGVLDSPEEVTKLIVGDGMDGSGALLRQAHIAAMDEATAVVDHETVIRPSFV